MLVSRTDVLKLDAKWLDEAGRLIQCRGVFIRQGKRAVNELNVNAGFLERLADGGVVGQLAGIYVPTGWQPQSQLSMTVQQNAILVDNEDCDGELSDQRREERGGQ